MEWFQEHTTAVFEFIGDNHEALRLLAASQTAASALQFSQYVWETFPFPWRSHEHVDATSGVDIANDDVGTSTNNSAATATSNPNATPSFNNTKNTTINIASNDANTTDRNDDNDDANSTTTDDDNTTNGDSNAAQTDWEQNFFKTFTTLAGRHFRILPKTLQKALSARKSHREKRKRRQRNFTIDSGIHPSANRINPFPPVPNINIGPRPRSPYPARGDFVCETQTIRDKWETHLASPKLADNRHARRPVHLLEPAKLRYDIPPSQSRILWYKGKIVGGVIRRVSRSFSGGLNVSSWGTDIVRDQTGQRQSIRRDDPGGLYLCGYTGGARNKSMWTWAKNRIGPKLPEEDICASDEQCSAAFAFLWNMCRQRLPPEVVEVFDNFLRTHNIRRMDARGSMVPEGATDHTRGSYTIELPDGDMLTFRDVELAPPSGAVGYNYARAMHTEQQAIPWAYSWTTHCSHPEVSYGGSFFLSKYGVRIQNATDSLIFWNPQEPHGTGLQDYDPNGGNPGFFQGGYCVFVPSRLPRVWADYQANNVTLAQAMEALDEDSEKSIVYV